MKLQSEEDVRTEKMATMMMVMTGDNEDDGEG